MGSTIVKTNKLWVVVIAGLILGFFISIAEPDLHILASQVDFVTSGLISRESIVVVVSIGIGTMLSLGFVRIVHNIPLHKVLTVLYLVIFILALFTSREFLAISFDASGATTGAMTVPFILALAAGVSALKKDSKVSEEDNFGLVAIASAGAILAVMIMSVISKTDTITASLEYNESTSTSIISSFIQRIPTIASEVILALLPILIIFILFQKVSFKLSRKALRKVLVGLLFTFIGFVLFLVGVNGGFMDVGAVIGYSVASLENKFYLVIVGFILGFVTVLAEPAVYVLTHQVEDVTSGYVKRKAVIISLAIGVGIAVALSMIRILVPDIQLWHYLLPGYLISLTMSYFVPKLFVGIAFDSGGVASGPMTATFILAFAHGAADAVEGASVLIDGFGMIAMVALTPLIALQILGFIFKVKSEKGGIEKSNE
ncbi:membrane protein [Thermobrachium celere]|nr:membrane protein [Thermobrachium celere]